MKRYALLLLIVLSALVLVGGAAADAARMMTAGDAFPIGPAAGEKSSPVAGMDNAGNMIVAWSQGDAVFFQRLNPDGTPNGGPVQANTATVERAFIGDISAGGAGNFVVVWDTYPDYEVRGRCFDAGGAPLGPDFALTETPFNLTFDPAVAMAADGSFVAVWSEQFYAGGYNDEIMGRRFSAACAPLGEPFTVNNGDTGDEREPDIAMNAAGGFIVAWEGRDDHWGGVFARFFGPDAAPQGGQFRVNQRQRFTQGGPSVAMDAAGNAVVVFDTESEKLGDEFNYDVLARRYNASGTALGDVFSPHDPSTAAQHLAKVVVAPAGDFAVMWTAVDILYDRDLWLRLYDAAGEALGPVQPVAVDDVGDQSMGTLATGDDGSFLAGWGQLMVGGTQLYGRLFDFDAPDAGQVFTPTNDAYVMAARPGKVYGASRTLQVKDAAKDTDTYVKFNVQGLTGTVQSATLRLWVTDPGPDGGTVYAVSPFYRGTTTLWLETGLNWNNAPVIGGAPLAVVGNVQRRQWVELDVTGAVIAALGDNGRVSFAVTNDSRNVVKYSSKEGVHAPELVVITN